MRRSLAALTLLLAAGLARADGLEIRGSSLVLTLADGRQLAADAVAGHEVAIDELTLRIGGVEKGAGAAPWLYELNGFDGDGWRPVCSPDAQGRRLAAFLPGLLGRDGQYHPEPGRLSVACTSGALGKCLVAGYAAEGDALPLFQSCLRLIRADYCGDGRSWTRDGTPVDIFDRVGIQTSTQPQLPLEAAWGPDGAVCVHHTRVRSRLSLDELRATCAKATRVAPEACVGTSALQLPGAVLFNRSAQGG